MKKTINLFLFFMLFLPTMENIAAMPENTQENKLIQTYFIFGKTYVLNENTKKWENLQIADILEKKSRLKTDPKSFIILTDQDQIFIIKEKTTALVADIFSEPINNEKKEDLAMVKLQISTANSIIQEAGLDFVMGLASKKAGEIPSPESEKADQKSITPQGNALLALEKGEYKKTLEIIKKNPKVFLPDEKSLLETLAYLLNNQGFESITACNALLSLKNISSEKKAFALYFLSLNYSWMGFHNNVGPLMEMFIDSFPKNKHIPEIYYLAAFGYRQINDFNSAEKYYNLLINRYPENPYSERARQQIESMKVKKGQ